MLYFISTPIGNLNDISLRAIDVIRSSDYLYAEDTRNIKKLLNFINLKVKSKSFHDHNEHKVSLEIIENLIPYVKNEVKKGTRLNQIMRHTIGLFHGQTGSNFWKRYLSENMCVRDADVKKIDHILDKVKLAPQTRSVG